MDQDKNMHIEENQQSSPVLKLMNQEKFCIYSYDVNELATYSEKEDNSQFDHMLQSCWGDRMKNNCFRYTLEDLETRCIPGKYGFIAQLNIKRATERRKPQFMSDIVMPFDAEKFHFGKVDSGEILFHLKPLHWETEENAPTSNVLIINVSPLEHCNSLLVPSIETYNPQVLNINGLRLGLEIIALSHNPALRVGMNSLGAYASVNHLHFHLYYLKETLYLQHAKMKQLIQDCYEIEDFPSRGFAFQLLERENILSISQSIMKLVEYFQREKIAHNIFMTRGNAFSDTTSKGNCFNAIRIFVWARKPSFGSKNDIGFNPALCELAGHLPIKERNYFENVTEEEVADILHEICCETFMNVKEKVKELYL